MTIAQRDLKPGNALRPTRARLAEALAAVTDADVPWWRERLAARHELCEVRGRDGAGDGVLLTGSEREARHNGVTTWTITDPRAAWEAMATAGLIGAGDVDEPRRRFIDLFVRMPNGGAITWGGQPLGPPLYSQHPSTVAACVAFAADWDGIIATEELARQIAADNVRIDNALGHAIVGDLVPIQRTPTAMAWRVVAREAYLREQFFRHDNFDGRSPSHPAAPDLHALGYLVESITDDAVTLACPGLA